MSNPLALLTAASKPKSDIDPLALEVTRDMNIESSKASNAVAKWEHEDLAKVRIRVFRDHEKGVNKCKFFADDTRVLSASEDCSIKVWDRQQGVVLQTLGEAHEENAADVDCTPTGDRMVSCGWDHKVHFWDMETGQRVLTHAHEDILTCCGISNDCRLMCVGSDCEGALYIYDLVSGDLVYELKGHHRSTVTTSMFSPADDRVITTSYDMTSKFFDLRSATCTVTLVGHSNVITSCSITQDERKFATASWDKTIRLWDVSTGMYRSQGPTILQGSHDGCISSCKFSDDSLLLVTGSFDRSVVVWDVENNIQKLKLQGHLDWVSDVQFSQDQNWLLTCSKDTTVRLWNIEESDKIPIVMENKRSGGLKVIKCASCAKPFSMAELDSFRDVTICVFCRQKSPEQSWLAFSDEPEM